MNLLKQLSVLAEEQAEEKYTDYEEWMEAVKKAFPDKASRIKFKGKAGKAGTKFNAEIPGEDRSYGEFDLDRERGWVSPD